MGGMNTFVMVIYHSTDNGLESLNGKIKSKNTLRVLNEGQGTIRKDKNNFVMALKEYQN